MRYAAVKFVSTDDYYEVPESWLFSEAGKDFSWWPKSSLKIQKLLNKPEIETPNSESWDKLEIVLLKLCGKANVLGLFLFFFSVLFLVIIYFGLFTFLFVATREQARKRAIDPSYVTTDDEKYGKGKRRRTEQSKSQKNDLSDAEDIDADLDDDDELEMENGIQDPVSPSVPASASHLPQITSVQRINSSKEIDLRLLYSMLYI